MSGHIDMTLPSTRRPRKSTGHSPVRKRVEKENITVDLASSLAGNAGRKKSRSKSIGPGGLDVLKSGSGNRRQSLAAPPKPTPRSILKPTMPLLPEIPPHKSKRKSPPSGSIQGVDRLSNPFQNEDSSSSSCTQVALRTEEEQQAAAREREERERAQLEKEINDRREARRKSLANRRVSFAAEATMHTFQVIEYMQDSTTSTDDTRRASSMATGTPSRADADDPPSTPPEQVEEGLPDPPEDQRGLHHNKRRSSSGGSARDYNDHDDHTLASSVYSSDSEGASEVQEEIVSDSGSDSDADGVTMDLDADEMTGTSVASAMTARSGFTDDSNGSLDDALRMATQRAETQNLDEEEEIIPSFGWVRKPAPKPTIAAHYQENQSNTLNEEDEEPEDTAAVDMEITKAMGGIIEPEDDNDNDDDHNNSREEDMSMDVTGALGMIMPSQIQDDEALEAGDDESVDIPDATMELTRAIGGIKSIPPFEEEDENEDMSMEFTSVMGGLVATSKANGVKRKTLPSRRQTLVDNGDTTMDMTVGMGRIISGDHDEEDEGDVTVGMDMTTAVGGIIRGQSPAKDQAQQAKQIMEEEADRPDGEMTSRTSPKRRLSDMLSARNISDAGSPGMLPFRGKGLRRSIDRRSPDASSRKSPIPNAVSRGPSSPKKTMSPATPQQSSPVKTPVSQRSPRRTASPQRPILNSSNTTPKSKSSTQQGLRSSVFQLDPSTGVTTPHIVLTPQNRQLSGVGADRPGLGSPKVAQILERRASIGDSAGLFVPQSGPRAVAFADPQSMEDEIERERRQEHERENNRRILEREADGDEENNTATLKDMISSMTPKKNLMKGRKSLHVGSARGLLGKRPAELDDEEDDYDRDGVKRLKNHQSSPVKNVRLHAPPSKEETTGRLIRSGGKTLETGSAKITTPSLTLSPTKEHHLASSPRGKGRFREVESDQPTNTVNFDETIPMSNPEAVVDDDEERIHLQDFLNMTSIRFMELTTTKRRHTEAPTTSKGFLSSKEDLSLERCVVAGACTVPMLELYQHSCRELKKYISEGRRIVREIETETLEENPPLFREYISATPEFKTLMDNQFKNVKTHARLLSKAMWYEWRMKLQDGLKEGLVKISDGMVADETLLGEQQKLLDSILPNLVQQCETLATEKDNLDTMARELAACDPQDLQTARSELAETSADIKAKQGQIEELRKQLKQTEANIGEAQHEKQACIADIEEAEKVREECRGWSPTEISTLKDRVDQLEKRHGWAVVGFAGNTISMTYQREIQLEFDMSLFSINAHGSRSVSDNQIELRYIGANRDQRSEVPPPEKEFFVQCIRDHVRRASGAMTQSRQSTTRQMLDTVSAAWKKADYVARAVRLLNCTFPTTVRRSSDASIAVRSTLLLAPIETKIEVVLELRSQDSAGDLQVSIAPQVRVVYGEHFKVDKMAEFLSTRIGTEVLTKEESPDAEAWNDVVSELHGRLLARGRK